MRPTLGFPQLKISIQTDEKEVAPEAPLAHKGKEKSAKREIERTEPTKEAQIEEPYDLDSPLEPEFNKQSPRAQDHRIMYSVAPPS